MKKLVLDELTAIIEELIQQGKLPAQCRERIQVTQPKDRSHGDYSSNFALTVAATASQSPVELAKVLRDKLAQQPLFKKIEIGGPGFINFFVHEASHLSIIETILRQAETFGCNSSGSGKRVQIEFVSANPTGPLHVGHGRGAAYGATLANLYTANGYRVFREYYVNDAGRQMDILATSVWLRYLELCGAQVRFPDNGYRGDYIWDIAASVHRTLSNQYYVDPELYQPQLPEDESQGGDKEKHIDALIATAKVRLGDEGYRIFFQQALQAILDDIKDDLSLFGVEFDRWYPESSLMQQHKVEQAITQLRSLGFLYEKDGALWFRSTAHGDEKDRVVIRENGQATYFASDIAYHLEKFERGFDLLINIWGADHHGYIARIKSALTAMGLEAERLQILLVQFANLYRGTQKIQMSTRSGEFVTLRALRKEAGTDAARFFYIMRRCDQHLDFDLELATSTSNDNPVYYVQYAHARICSVLRQLNGTELSKGASQEYLRLLTDSAETELAQYLNQYPDTILQACEKQAPHLLVSYLRELAQKFHAYYNSTHILVDEILLRNARVMFINAIKQVLVNGLHIIGVQAPEKM